MRLLPSGKRETFFLASVAIGLAVLLVCGTTARRPKSGHCPSSPQTLLFADTAAHTLTLCDRGKPTRSFTVRIGHKGTGKSREGDGKTPLGVYPIESPRASADYGIFIPIAYPTVEQRRRGFTGSSVGVHGPSRGVRWAGAFVNTFDTTDGCIGIATDSEMNQIADWARASHAKRILIE